MSSLKLKISKGPWRYVTKYAPGVLPEGRVYSDKEGVVVCEVGGYEDRGYVKDSRERWDADKRLIAAAPELLECLEELCQALEGSGGVVYDEEVVYKARRVIVRVISAEEGKRG